MSSFFDIASSLQKQGRIRESFSTIYQGVEEHVRLETIDHLNEQIQNLSLEEMNTDIMLAILTATLPVKTKLVSRKFLFERIMSILIKRNHFETGILDGLD